MRRLMDGRHFRVWGGSEHDAGQDHQMSSAPIELMQRSSDGTKWEPRFHPGQWRAWESQARFIVVLAGTQSGKTTFGPHWLLREIKNAGFGDYMTVTPTFPLLELKALKEFKRLFIDQMKLGTYVANPVRRFTFSHDGMHALYGDAWGSWERKNIERGTVTFGYAEDPDSLEAATLKGVWADEAGQDKFKLGSYEALLRRASIHQGRFLFTTTIYNMGWIKSELYDRWLAGDPDIDVIQFDSTENPAFPPGEYEKRRLTMPAWKFDMMYRGIFTRPAGLIYDCFDPRRHVLPSQTPPADWERVIGLDFGENNTAATVAALDPKDDRVIVYREYHPGLAERRRTNAQHIGQITEGLPRDPFGKLLRVRAWGGAHGEKGWRDAFTLAGLPVMEPTPNDVEVQINRVYAALLKDEFFVTKDCPELVSQFGQYQRAVDDQGDPLPEIRDKAKYHLLDTVRYLVSQVKRGESPRGTLPLRWREVG
jgi:hypothetical protein